MTDLRQTLYLIADEMRGMASLTKHFSKNIYEQEQAERLMKLAAKLAAIAGKESLADVEEVFLMEPWQRFSPAIGVDAAVFDEEDRVLLIQRADNHRWALPGGLAEIGQTLPEAALRELWEEAGLRGKVRGVLGIFDGVRWQTRERVHLVHVVFQVDCENLAPNPGIEALQARYFSAGDLPADMHPGHDLRVPRCFALRNGNTYFDPADSSVADFSSLQRPNDT
ncbi:MAG: NUDIX hydrolase N-terminal domain-containing protein [Anaerolineae bacterium]|nr:NUDIX hydrolase N-terminal domain-containing protein [Anaerolineae bacterium]